MEHLLSSVFAGFVFVLAIVLLSVPLRRRWIAGAVLAFLMVPVYLPATGPLAVAFAVAFWGLLILAPGRFGLTAAISSWFVYFLLWQFPATTDPSVWTFSYTALAVALAAGLGIFGWHTAVFAPGLPKSPRSLTRKPA